MTAGVRRDVLGFTSSCIYTSYLYIYISISKYVVAENEKRIQSMNHRVSKLFNNSILLLFPFVFPVDL